MVNRLEIFMVKKNKILSLRGVVGWTGNIRWRQGIHLLTHLHLGAIKNLCWTVRETGVSGENPHEHRDQHRKLVGLRVEPRSKSDQQTVQTALSLCSPPFLSFPFLRPLPSALCFYSSNKINTSNEAFSLFHMQIWTGIRIKQTSAFIQHYCLHQWLIHAQ